MDANTDAADRGIGDNSAGIGIEIEVRLFNSLARNPGGPRFRRLALPAGARVADILDALGIDPRDVFLILRNGRDVTRGRVGDPVNLETTPEDGDVIALSGPVPFSWGYGAPVV